ncbi:hypothetical protein M758_7G023200 [Ceratodon purpureus]|nr:hypothetical protein M758_7G023200 [Ceratodon purpureus]
MGRPVTYIKCMADVRYGRLHWARRLRFWESGVSGHVVDLSLHVVQLQLESWSCTIIAIAMPKVMIGYDHIFALHLGMAFQWRDSLKWINMGESSVKYFRLRVHHLLTVVVLALVSIAALFTDITTTSRLPGPEDGRFKPLGPARLSRPWHGRMVNESEFMAFVESEDDAEHEKDLIKEVLQGNQLDPRGGHRGRAARRPSRLPSPHYAPFWPEFRAMLRARVDMKRYDPKVMQSLVATIKVPIERHRQKALKPGLRRAAQRRYASCAVVGNSGILLNSTYGEAIDAHEAVVRLNNARAKGFETHVGRKTTIAFMNSNILHKCARRVRCYCQAYGGDDGDNDDVAIVMYVSQVQHLMDVAMCRPAHAAPLLVTDPRFDALTARIAKWYSVREFVECTGKGVSEWPWVGGFHYSSGMQAVMLALGICEEVDLYGFGKANGTKHHYHTAQPQELHIHDYAAEYIFYDELAVPSSQEAIPFLRDTGIRHPRVRVFGHEQL